MDTKDLCEHTRIRLIAAAVGHQQCTKTESTLIPLPGTKKFIAIGTLPAIAKVLMVEPPAVAASIPPSTAPAPQTFSERDIPADAPRAFAKRYSALLEENMKLKAELEAAKAAPAPQTDELTTLRAQVEQLQAMLEDRVSRKPNDDQEWAKHDGAIAFHLIERHADNWNDAGNMMESWARARAKAAQAAPSAPTDRELKGKTVVGWYVAYCEASAKLKEAEACIGRYEKLISASKAAPSAKAEPVAWLDQDGRMIGALRDFIEGMSVSMDVSTGEDDAGHRYFGIINEVMDDDGDKNGVTLLVYDAQPNFAAPAPAVQAEDVRDKLLLDSLDAWVERNKANGHHHFVFAFDTSSTARQQIAEDEIVRSALRTLSTSQTTGQAEADNRTSSGEGAAN